MSGLRPRAAAEALLGTARRAGLWVTQRRDFADFRVAVKAEIFPAEMDDLDKMPKIEEHGGTMPHQDFTIDSLARYLHLNPQQVTRLVEQGRLPGRKVAGQWRFPRAEIHHWLERRIGLSDEEELIEVEGVLRRSGGEEEQAICIVEMLPEEAIAIPLPARTRSSVFTSIVETATRSGLLWDPEKMIEAIRSREDMYPTAMPGGIALLHPRRPMPTVLAQAFLALGVTATGIPFGGEHGGLTDIFFLICSVEDRGHLQTLARLARVIGTSGFLEDLRRAPDAAEAHRLIHETEKNLTP